MDLIYMERPRSPGGTYDSLKEPCSCLKLSNTNKILAYTHTHIHAYLQNKNVKHKYGIFLIENSPWVAEIEVDSLLFPTLAMAILQHQKDLVRVR